MIWKVKEGKERHKRKGLHKRKVIGNFNKHSFPERYRKKLCGRELRGKDGVRMIDG